MKEISLWEPTVLTRVSFGAHTRDLKKMESFQTLDREDLPYKYVCLVGQTMPLDLEEYLELKREDGLANAALVRICTR